MKGNGTIEREFVYMVIAMSFKFVLSQLFVCGVVLESQPRIDERFDNWKVDLIQCYTDYNTK